MEGNRWSGHQGPPNIGAVIAPIMRACWCPFARALFRTAVPSVYLIGNFYFSFARAWFFSQSRLQWVRDVIFFCDHPPPHCFRPTCFVVAVMSAVLFHSLRIFVGSPCTNLVVCVLAQSCLQLFFCMRSASHFKALTTPIHPSPQLDRAVQYSKPPPHYILRWLEHFYL